MDGKIVYNVNVGVLGHVDAGKTSLVGALSTTLSTAALDKHPQSKERGITLDLGFSSFSVPAPPLLHDAGYDLLQFTLVDCPGHASLIRTVVGGAHIIDVAVLVVDVTKGIQTQTAECIVIAEITTNHMVVVLNKIDLLPADKRSRYLAKAKKLVAATLAVTKFSGSPMVGVAARAVTDADSDSAAASSGIPELVDALAAAVKARESQLDKQFLFNIDHCFAVKGQGTVLTGTVAEGSARVGDSIQLPRLGQQRRIKSIQMFRRPVERCQHGDRVGICLAQLDAGLIERGLACSPGAVPTYHGAVAAVTKVRFYPGAVRTQGKMHVIVGHQTVMAKLLFFGTPDGAQQQLSQYTQGLSLGQADSEAGFDFEADYLLQEELYGVEGRPVPAPGTPAAAAAPRDQAQRHYGRQWVLMQFEEPVTAPADAVIICARLDADLHASSCRIALHGRVCALVDPDDAASLHRLRVYKVKGREGSVERVESDGRTAVCRGMFQKDSDLSRFVGMAVTGPLGEAGVIEGSFGKSGKFKVHFLRGIRLQKAQPAPITLTFKRYLFDPDKRRMAQ